MRIASVDVFAFLPENSRDTWFPRKPLTFVRVTSDQGHEGWGEVHPLTHREAALRTLVRALGERLVGSPVRDVKALLHLAVNGFGEQRIGMDVYAAASAVEIACWDILGQDAGRPVHALIGGALYESIPLYANVYSRAPRSPAELAARAGGLAQAGFKTIKFYPFVGDATLAQGVDKVRAVRDAVGPDVRLGIDLWRGFTPDAARAICRAVEPFDLAWVEDPVAPVDARTYADLRAAVGTPLVTGESLAGKAAFRDLFEHRAAGIVNPDVCACGGILEMREIAAMADVVQILIAPHNANSMTVGLAATAHVAAGIPNLECCEYFPEWEADLDAVCPAPMRAENGALALPEAPGLGVALDASKLERVG